LEDEPPKGNLETKTEEPIIKIPNSNIHPLENSWRIENVFYRGETKDYLLSKSLLEPATQNEMAAQYLIAKKNNDFHCADISLYYAIFKSLYNSPCSKQKEEARNFIQKSMREKYLGTLTRFQYPVNGKDKIIHNYGILGEEDFKQVNLAGHNREINSGDEDILEALLLTRDIDEVKEIFNWINPTPTWILRVNKKPKKSTYERVAGFVVDSDGAGVGCNWVPSYCYSDLGVKVA
jgi:hypothetical protein